MLSYIKIYNSVGRNDNFLAKARKLPILPTSLDIFDIRQHYMRILYLYNLDQDHTVHVYSGLGLLLGSCDSIIKVFDS